jgi:hypothetical protein
MNPHRQGSEFKKHVDTYLKEEGIKHKITPSYNPDQNSVVEWANWTIISRTHTIIEDAKFPKELWMEITTMVVYLKNCSPMVTLNNCTPYKAWHKKKPDLQHL